MKPEPFKLSSPPIVEVVIDIDCDLPPNSDFNLIEKNARNSLKNTYPKIEHQAFVNHSMTPKDEQTMNVEVHQGLEAIRFCSEDKKQYIQFRRFGYSFNRLSPYEGLNTYLPEIKRTWELFVSIVQPVKIRKIGLRTINRILLPLKQGKLSFEEYLVISPKLPSCNELTSIGFLNQHMTVEPKTNHRVGITVFTQQPEDEKLPLILDVDSFSINSIKGLQWEVIRNVIEPLRVLKNNVFRSIVTEECLSLF